MILDRDRPLAAFLVRLRLWRIVQANSRTEWTMRCARLRAGWGTQWLWNWMLKRQTHDGLHHAPCCPGNEWLGAELVIQRCNCGARR